MLLLQAHFPVVFHTRAALSVDGTFQGTQLLAFHISLHFIVRITSVILTSIYQKGGCGRSPQISGTLSTPSVSGQESALAKSR
jgi:hypothetical protein